MSTGMHEHQTGMGMTARIAVAAALMILASCFAVVPTGALASDETPSAGEPAGTGSIDVTVIWANPDFANQNHEGNAGGDQPGNVTPGDAPAADRPESAARGGQNSAIASDAVSSPSSAGSLIQTGDSLVTRTRIAAGMVAAGATSLLLALLLRVLRKRSAERDAR